MDVLVRAVNAALFVSHDIREDSHVLLHLMGGEAPPRRIWFNGSDLSGVRPDERSIAGQIKAVMKRAVPPNDRFEEYTCGILHSGGGLDQTLKEWSSRGVFPVILDAGGSNFSEIPTSTDVGFVLSDDKPFTEHDRSSLREAVPLSLGDRWLQGHSCIAVVHHLLDAARTS
jgi:tRNA (pseudouridine54-N1)-methyltransferase